MAPLQSSEAAVNSISGKGGRLGPTKSFGKDPLAPNPLSDGLAFAFSDAPRCFGKENESASSACTKRLSTPGAPRKSVLFRTPRAVLYSPIKFNSQKKSTPSNSLGLFDQILDNEDRCTTSPSLSPISLALFPLANRCSSASLQLGQVEACLDNHEGSQVLHDVTATGLSNGFSDLAKSQVIGDDDSESSTSTSQGLGVVNGASPASVHTEIITPTTPDRWREDAYFADHSSSVDNEPSPSLSEVFQLVLPKVGNRLALTTATGGNQVEEDVLFYPSQVAGEVSKPNTPMKQAAILHGFFSPSSSIAEAQGPDTQIASPPPGAGVLQLNSPAQPASPEGPPAWAYFEAPLADLAEDPPLPDWTIHNLYTYLPQELDAHFFRRARISKFDPQEPCPSNLYLLSDLTSALAYGITIKCFREILVRCSNCLNYVFTDFQSKHTCGGVVLETLAPRSLYQCWVANGSAGITIDKLKAVLAMCDGCERVLPDTYGNLHRCNPDVAQDS